VQVLPSAQVLEPVYPVPPLNDVSYSLGMGFICSAYHCPYLATAAPETPDATGLATVARVVGTATMLLAEHADLVETGAAVEVFALHALLVGVTTGVAIGATAEDLLLQALLIELVAGEELSTGAAVADGTVDDGTSVTGSRSLATLVGIAATLLEMGAAVVAGMAAAVLEATGAAEEATGAVPELAPSQTAGPGMVYEEYAP